MNIVAGGPIVVVAIVPLNSRRLVVIVAGVVPSVAPITVSTPITIALIIAAISIATIVGRTASDAKVEITGIGFLGGSDKQARSNDSGTSDTF